jgi:hypothetical protein
MSDKRNALEKYFIRLERQQNPGTPRRHHEKPEKHITLPLVLRECQKLGMKMFKVDASSYDVRTGRMGSGNQVQAGFPDLCGIGPGGESLWIELKAPGKRYNLSDLQYEFLKNAILHAPGVFATVVDSPGNLLEIWQKWISSGKSSEVLLKYLPRHERLQAQMDGSSPFGFDTD